ncbi:Na(+)/H(+) exchange regulatory cofactor NHE-RF4 isoform X3 [Artibeus jamaicensis]|uniref:Na(+)/H(+) exchange regulatory cofactor NHE-RF4 isoform X3 n=1 Tax=Artibeus jamaicensis TaxID=9417 RepID=UPI00235AC350|nr:Na(+)/H(+) exchange regulatory cofactor NHE-RF4 isoform X3 [Artibeus jamaicensis]
MRRLSGFSGLCPYPEDWVVDLTMEAAADLQDTASLTLKFQFNPKLGIDNPVLSLAEDHNLSDLWNLERPRFCLLSKEEGRSFGFHLHQELGKASHVVCRVEPGSSAQQQGLREGDRILAVNNHVVEHEDAEVVVLRIQASGPRVLLTVLAQHVYDVSRAQQGNDVLLCPTLSPGVRPRLCHVVKDEGGFGFSVTYEHQGSFRLVLSTGGAAERAGVPPGARLLEVNGVSVEKFTYNQLSRKFLREVNPGLPAERAGMQDGDRLVAVAGESVEGLGHEETVYRIRAQGSRVSLTVVDPEADHFFSMVRVRLSPLLFLEGTEAPASPQDTCLASLVETKDPPVEDTAVPPIPCGSHQCFLYPGPGGGYGFRLSYVASGPCLFISQVIQGSSAAQAGLQRGDVILEVNGNSVDGFNDLEMLRQLTEAEPPLCLKLVTRFP